MPKRITIQPHLSLDELEIRYRGAKDPIERSHYQIIWLLACGRPTEEVADVTGYSRNWISTETEIITQPFKKSPRLQQISPIEGCVIIYSHPLSRSRNTDNI